MSRGRKVALLALGALVSVAALPASAQVVVGEYRPSVDVNWDVLDKLGPEPTLPGLVTRPPSASLPAAPRPVARPAAAPKATGFKPYAEAAPKAAAPKAEPKAETAATAPKAVIPAAEPPKAAEPAKVAEAPKASGPAPRPAKPDIAAEVPVPPKAPAKAPEPVKAEPAKTEPVKAPEPPKVVEAPKAPEPAPKAPEPVKAPEPPSAVQFVKTPPPAPAAPAPMPVVPAPVVQAPPVAPPLPVAPPPVVASAPPPVVASAPPPVVASAPPPQVAALPPAAPSRKGDNLTVPFATDSSHLPESARAELDRLAQRMDRDESLNLQLMAYAAGDEANASKARRLSLSRALEVRKYLMEMGVRSTRIEVRALGNKVEGGAPDRVDAMLVAR